MEVKAANLREEVQKNGWPSLSVFDARSSVGTDSANAGLSA